MNHIQISKLMNNYNGLDVDPFDHSRRLDNHDRYQLFNFVNFSSYAFKTQLEHEFLDYHLRFEEMTLMSELN